MTARVLAIMGSGETSPTMVTTHKRLLDRVGPKPPAVLLDTPFGFQENADELAARAVTYFAESVGATIEVASLRTTGISGLELEEALNRIRRARYVFAGPGSPTYALGVWKGSPVPELLMDKLRGGGCVTFASAAALTLGAWTVPVYEIYKVGSRVHWLEGLDLLSATGLRAAVIPHYDNAEGGTHDTRFCYLGERRLSIMESELPDDAFVLGIDEHTGCLLDLDAGTAEVVGRGVVTVRRGGRSTTLPTGTTVTIDDIRRLAEEVGSGAAVSVGGGDDHGGMATGAPSSPGSDNGADAGGSPLMEAVRGYESSFDKALAAGDARGAVEAVLDLEAELTAWSADTLQSDEMDRGRATLRSMILRLGEAAEGGLRDPRQVVGPLVELILAERQRARADRRFADADGLRDALVDHGVEVRDTPEGTTWELRAAE